MAQEAVHAQKSALAAKLAKILGEVGKVEKTGHNSFHKYDYVTESALLWAVRNKLAEAGVFVFTSIEGQTHEIVTSEGRGGEAKQSLLTTVTTKHTFVDGESGEQFAVFSQGQGSDAGDKGAYKAITGAMKYFLFKNFMVPTEDDPERDETTDERTAGGVSRSAGSQARSSTTAQRDSAPEVPRDADVDEIKRFEADYENDKWTAVKIHFGKDKGIPLGKMEAEKLKFWLGYKPEPFRGKFNEADLRLRAALNVADREWK